MKITPEDIKTIVRANYNREATYITVHDLIARILREKYQGKKLTKRIEDQVKGALEKAKFDGELRAGAPVVSFTKDGTLSHLSIWGIRHAEDFSKRMYIFLGYNGEIDNYDAATFEEHDARNGRAAKERNAERSKLLSSEAELAFLAELVNKIRHAKTELKVLTAALANIKTSADSAAIGDLTKLEGEK